MSYRAAADRPPGNSTAPTRSERALAVLASLVPPLALAFLLHPRLRRPAGLVLLGWLHTLVAASALLAWTSTFASQLAMGDPLVDLGMTLLLVWSLSALAITLVVIPLTLWFRWGRTPLRAHRPARAYRLTTHSPDSLHRRIAALFARQAAMRELGDTLVIVSPLLLDPDDPVQPLVGPGGLLLVRSTASADGLELILLPETTLATRVDQRLWERRASRFVRLLAAELEATLQPIAAPPLPAEVAAAIDRLLSVPPPSRGDRLATFALGFAALLLAVGEAVSLVTLGDLRDGAAAAAAGLLAALLTAATLLFSLWAFRRRVRTIAFARGDPPVQPGLVPTLRALPLLPLFLLAVAAWPAALVLALVHPPGSALVQDLVAGLLALSLLALPLAAGLYAERRADAWRHRAAGGVAGNG